MDSCKEENNTCQGLSGKEKNVFMDGSTNSCEGGYDNTYSGANSNNIIKIKKVVRRILL